MGVFSKLIHAGVSFANCALICLLMLEGCESATDNMYKSGGGGGVCVCVGGVGGWGWWWCWWWWWWW